ncbi:MAG: GNAT family N-acetyltransferase [Candidatus Woesearchaeota archaeon]
MRIRKYLPEDRISVERVHFETGFLGKSMSRFLSNNHLWRKEAAHYLNDEPEHVFVLETKGRVIGYLFGSFKNKSESDFKFVLRIFSNFFRGLFLPKKDRFFWANKLKHFFKIIFGKSGELNFDIHKTSAHIHINILPEGRGLNWGTKLLEEFEKVALSEGITHIHANSYQTSVNPNSNFWFKNGFVEHSKVKTLYWCWVFLMKIFFWFVMLSI